MKNEASNYVPRPKTIGWHTIKHEELNELYQSAGWIGRRRFPVVFLKTLPVVESSRFSAGSDGR